jgi:hypothetical protein
MIMANDAHAAYQCALRYHISGDTNYANKAIQIMNAWADTLTLVTGDSNWLLAAGIQGYQWASAAELMRTTRRGGGGFPGVPELAARPVLSRDQRVSAHAPRHVQHPLLVQLGFVRYVHRAQHRRGV